MPEALQAVFLVVRCDPGMRSPGAGIIGADDRIGDHRDRSSRRTRTALMAYLGENRERRAFDPDLPVSRREVPRQPRRQWRIFRSITYHDHGKAELPELLDVVDAQDRAGAALH